MFPEFIQFCMCWLLFVKDFIYLFFERREGRIKRGTEASMCGCFSHPPYWGPGPQPRPVPWLGNWTCNPSVCRPVSIHWATPARADCWLLFNIRKDWGNRSIWQTNSWLKKIHHLQLHINQKLNFSLGLNAIVLENTLDLRQLILSVFFMDCILTPLSMIPFYKILFFYLKCCWYFEKIHFSTIVLI